MSGHRPPRVLMLVQAGPPGPLPVPGQQRRHDYQLVQQELAADTIDLTTVAAHRWSRGLQRLAGDQVALAVLAFLHVVRRDAADVVLCDSENEALLLALLLSLTRSDTVLATLAMSPAADKKRGILRLLGGRTRVDLWVCHSTVQAERLIRLRGVAPARVHVLPFHTDPLYFDPCRVETAGPEPAAWQGERPYVLSVGREERDYPTLVRALADAPVDVVIDASSPYSRSPDSLADVVLPPSVRLVRLVGDQLRAAYAGAAVVVVPTRECDFGPGQTSLLEGMAMARAVVMTRAAGSGDVLVDRRSVLRDGPARATSGVFARTYAPDDADAGGPHGCYVPPDDPAALRRAVLHLLAHPHEAQRMGRSGRALVLSAFGVDQYVQRLAGLVHRAWSTSARAQRTADALATVSSPS